MKDLSRNLFSENILIYGFIKLAIRIDIYKSIVFNFTGATLLIYIWACTGTILRQLTLFELLPEIQGVLILSFSGSVEKAFLS